MGNNFDSYRYLEVFTQKVGIDAPGIQGSQVVLEAVTKLGFPCDSMGSQAWPEILKWVGDRIGKRLQNTDSPFHRKPPRQDTPHPPLFHGQAPV
jgi:hypothetical protein